MASAAARLIPARRMVNVTAASAIVTIWLGLLGLITTPVLLHRLGAALYGIFALIALVSAYLSNLELGFGHATVRFLAPAYANDDRRGEDRVVSTSLAVFLVAGAVASVIAFVGAPVIARTFAHTSPRLRPEAIEAVRIGAAILFASFMASFWAVCLQAYGRFRPLVLSRAFFGTLSSIAAITAVLLGGSLQLVLITQLIVTSATCLVLAVALARASGRWVGPHVHWPTFRAMAKFGVFVLLSGIAYQVMLQGPPTVLAGRSSTRELAAYAVPSLVLQQLILLATSVSLSFFSFASASSIDSDRSHLRDVFRSNLRLTLLAMGAVCAVLVAFAHPLMSAWIGPGFAVRAAPALQFLAVGALMVALSAAPSDLARGLGRPSWVTWFTFVAAALGVGISFITVETNGAGGAALAFMLALIVAGLPFIVLAAALLLGFGPVSLFRSLFLPFVSVAALAAVCVAGRTITSTAGAVLVGVVGVLAYVILAYRYVLYPTERTVLSRASSSFALSLPGLRKAAPQ